MQYPVINLNGSDAMELARQYQEAANAVEVAVEKMGRIVHGRDYQTADAFAFGIAQNEMAERIKPLIAAYNDLNDLALHCANVAYGVAP